MKFVRHPLYILYLIVVIMPINGIILTQYPPVFGVLLILMQLPYAMEIATKAGSYE